MIKIKRAYEAQSPEDGYRIYVDRIWPRGLSHETFHYDQWDKEIAPSTELRHWFHESPSSRWEEFRGRYRQELECNPDASALAREVAKHAEVTLLYSSKDETHNNAVILQKYLEEKLNS